MKINIIFVHLEDNSPHHEKTDLPHMDILMRITPFPEYPGRPESVS